MKIIFWALLIIIAVAVGTAYFGNTSFITSKDNMSEEEKANLLANLPELPDLGEAAEIIDIESWINSEPLTLENLKGKVVLIDFWTYSCINCIRTLPHLSGWYEKYKNNGFVLLSVHSPEFEFEKDRENVLAAVKKYGLNYPVALDNNFSTWKAYSNRYWPAHYLVDAKGNLRFTHFGEGRYKETESAIQKLLLEAGLLTLDNITEAKTVDPSVDFRQIETPETYLGYLRISNLGNAGENVKPDEPYAFPEPENIENNKFYLVGNWVIRPEFSELVADKGKIIIRYKASKVHMVLSSKNNEEITLNIKLDGKDLGEVLVREPDKYTLIDTGNDYDWHTLEIFIESPGLQAFAFTFG